MFFQLNEKVNLVLHDLNHKKANCPHITWRRTQDKMKVIRIQRKQEKDAIIDVGTGERNYMNTIVTLP